MRAIGTTLVALGVLATAQGAQAGFVDNGDGTVTDLNSTFMWQRCSAPAATADCSTSLPETYSWEDALTFCNGLELAGYTDWRLPNVKELQSILDMEKTTAPSIDTRYFPDTMAEYYWTSTTAEMRTRAWHVDFDTLLMAGTLEKFNAHYVRCVRGG